MNDRLFVVLKWCRRMMKDNYINHFEAKKDFARFIDQMVGAKKAMTRPTPAQQDGVDMNDL